VLGRNDIRESFEDDMSSDRSKARRRGHGEGSIYQRADGRWVAVLDLGYVGGKRKRQTFYRKTRKEASAKLNEELANLRKGGIVASSDTTVESFLTMWLEQSVQGHKAPRTVESYTSIIDRHIVPEIGRYRIGRLDQSHVQMMLNRKKAEGLSARTVAYIRAVLRTAFNDAMQRGIIVRNVAAFAKPPRGDKREPHPFTLEEIRRFFASVADDRHEAAYVIAGTLGLRRGEVLGLRWSDVDEQVGAITVRQQVQRVGGKDQLLPLKTKKSVRTLPLTTSLREALQRRKQQQAQERLLAGDRWQESELIFTSTVGTVLNPGNFYERYRQALKRADLAGHTFHDLRHTASTLLVRQGVHPRVAMEILGHSQISVTMDVYAHVVGDSMRDALASIENALEGEK
jgi:integrase